MKLKKFKYLLSIGASALAIAPIASLAINPTNNAIVKTNVKNNAEGDSGEQSTGETADSSSTLITPVQPADGSIKADTLSPAPNDLYNEYNFESGYVIKDVASGTISFYNWYKQEVWTITVNSDSVTNFPTDKTIGTMNIKGALTQDGTYDTKLFVYGNFSSDSTTTGSYVFEVDMETGKYVDNTLVTNTNPTQSDQNTTTLIGDANLLTVINSNTIIITPKANTTTTNFTYKISFSEITFNSGSDPTVVDYNNVSIDKYTGWYIGEIVGVIETNNQYVFAFKSYDSKNSESFGILEVYFKKSTSGTTTTTLTYTPFNESKSLQNNSVNNNSFDYMPFENSPESLSSSSSSNGISATNNTTYDSKTMEALNSSFNNISVVYSGTIDNPRMLISCNWDSTDLSSNYELSDAAATKVLVTELSKDGSAPTLGTFSVSSSTGRSGVTYLGISNLVSTRNANVGPYAVAVGYGVATAQANTGYDTGSLNRIWFNLVSLNGTLTNTTNSSSNDNGTTYALTSGKWINTFDAYTTNNSTPSNTNKNKIDWQLQFIPNNGTAASGSTDITNYYGYISTGKEQSDKSIAWQENFFQIPKTVTTEGIVDYFLNDYQFGVTNDELTKVYKAIDAATELTTIDKNAFATNATAQSVIDNLYQM
ncbi:MAG: hypothetical protein HUJ42_02790, partial [Malacoplasma sp.]|nr:hypothetical protein [Malacoplasma sp.]